MSQRPLRRLPSGVVASVIAGGPGARAGLLPGDRVLAINGLVPRDVIDVRLDGLGSRVELDVKRDGRQLVLTAEKAEDEDLGVEFESAAFDRLKTCNNRCDFCFIRGLPGGLRRSLYIKDDDFRYSFLYGSFTTLTNLSDLEWRRILFQRLSPLRVSVHATEPDLRRELLGNPSAPPILAQLDELRAHGIEVHAQVVLMPGRNDGPVLEATIRDLGERHPGVGSVAVVPVGLTAHSRVMCTRPLEASDAGAAIDLIEAYQRRYRRAAGIRFVYGGDELYLLAGRALPGPRSYDAYPQLHNGVGLVQLFRSDWRRAVRRLPSRLDPAVSVCWVTGALMAPILQELAADLAGIAGLRVHVVPVPNTLFGGQVTVAGLTSARDVVAALEGGCWARVILPRSMFDAGGGRTIDDWDLRSIARALDAEVCIAATPRDLVETTLGAGSPRP